MIESLFMKSNKEIKIIKILGFVYSFFVVCVGFVIFRADSLLDAFYFIKNMFGFGNNIINSEIFLYLTPFYLFIYVSALVGCTGVFKKIANKLSEKHDYVLMGLSISYLLLCFMRLASDSYNPFIYFRF